MLTHFYQHITRPPIGHNNGLGFTTNHNAHLCCHHYFFSLWYPVGIWRVSWVKKEPVTAPCKAPSGAGLTGTGVPLALPWGPYSYKAPPPLLQCFTLNVNCVGVLIPAPIWGFLVAGTGSHLHASLFQVHSRNLP
jgi:hypothetical protein